jgi:hypothetical protein
MGVAGRVADYAQIPALHEGRGMVAGRMINVRITNQFRDPGRKAACVKSSHLRGAAPHTRPRWQCRALRPARGF